VPWLGLGIGQQDSQQPEARMAFLFLADRRFGLGIPSEPACGWVFPVLRCVAPWSTCRSPVLPIRWRSSSSFVHRSRFRWIAAQIRQSARARFQGTVYARRCPVEPARQANLRLVRYCHEVPRLVIGSRWRRSCGADRGLDDVLWDGFGREHANRAAPR